MLNTKYFNYKITIPQFQVKKLECDFEKLRKKNVSLEQELGDSRERDEERSRGEEEELSELNVQKSYMVDRIKVSDL